MKQSIKEKFIVTPRQSRGNLRIVNNERYDSPYNEALIINDSRLRSPVDERSSELRNSSEKLLQNQLKHFQKIIQDQKKQIDILEDIKSH